MRAAKPILGLLLIVLSAWPAKLAVALFATFNRPQFPPGPGVIVHHTVVLYGHQLAGWRLAAALVLLSLTALSAFILGLSLSFSILRDPK